MLAIDTRVKLILFVLVNFMVFGLKNIYLGMICFGAICILSLFMGQKKHVIKYVIIYAVTMTVQYLSQFTPKTIFSLLSVFTLFVRVMIPVMLFSSVFISTTKVSEMIAAMFSMKMPRSLVITFAMTLRFFPTFSEEMHNIYDAMKLRGINISLKNVFTRPLLLFEAMLVPIIMRSASIAEELSASAVTRGLDNPSPRSSFVRFRITASDVTVLALFLMLFVVLFYCKYRLYGRI